MQVEDGMNAEHSRAAAPERERACIHPLRALQDLGQSVWLDFIRRDLLTSGELRRLVEQDGLSGVTSNPSILEKAIVGGDECTRTLEATEGRDVSPEELYERIAVRDIRCAADVLRPVYDRTRARDGYVSLEVSPHLAHDTRATVEAARRLWGLVRRDNLMIKVPATPDGISAVRRLIGEGLNVNVTLLFSQQAYEEAAEAYIAGLEELVARGGNPARVASVASFFVSRIDAAVDPMLREKQAAPGCAALARGLAGKVAIANARVAYQRYRRIFGSSRWQRLASAGARPQRLLWASTGTKDPAYRDVVYVEALIGPDTVNTLPPATYEAFRDHGRARRTLDADPDAARRVPADLASLGISLDQVASALLQQGLDLFRGAHDRLLASIAERCAGRAG
jgi:transaldolase/glucose-6-phosphate isomerase